MMIKSFRYIFFLLQFVLNSFALIEIDITEGNREPLPIAITNFFYDDERSKDLDQVSIDISKVISADLERSGLFRSIDQEAFIQKTASMHIRPRHEDWRLINAQALVTGELTIEKDKLRVEFRLWDTFAEKEIEALVLITTIDNWRRISHMIADKIYERLTGEEGYLIQEYYMYLKVDLKIIE